MLLFNLPKKQRPMVIAKGVNKDGDKVQAIEPAFKPKPFPNYMGEMLLTTDPSLMGYDRFGAYTPSELIRQSNREAMVRMAENSSLIDILNDRRRRNF